MDNLRFSALVVIICAVSAVSAVAAGAEINVAPDGLDHPEGGSPHNPLHTIQYALDAASHGDTVIIHPGVYTGPGNYELTPRGKDLRIRGFDPADPIVVAATVINPEREGRAFNFTSGESAACVVQGLTITGGHAGHGGAIRCENSSPTILQCVIIDNKADLHGGGVFLVNSNSVIRECVIARNIAAYDGGGVESWDGDITLVNCLIYANASSFSLGGGVDIFNSLLTRIINCTIADNRSENGGGLYLWASTAAVENSIFWNNTAPVSSQIGLQPASAVTVTWSSVQGGYPGEGNIDADPLFVGQDPWQAVPSDYHLMSEWGRYQAGAWVADPLTSPCIVAGNPASDYSSEPWPHGRRINMGAFGGTPLASKYGNPADFDIDGRVDWRDLAAFAENWLTFDAGIYNLDGAGRVDMKDAAIFMNNWRWQKPVDPEP